MTQTEQTFTINGQVSPPPLLTDHLRMGGSNSPESRIEVNNRYLTKDGQPWLPVMGEFHFSRYPRPYWPEALLKMKAAGISIVTTYIFWLHHEEVEGEWNWTGNFALRDLAELCAQHKLYLYPRIGPWAHGECRNGGFPDWLLQKCPVVRADHPIYLEYVEKFYRQIYRQIEGYLYKDNGPIIGIQLENEYGHVGETGHPDHILTLKALARRIGFEVPLYTVTGWGGAWVPPGEVLPVLGGYPAAPWTGHTRRLDPVDIYLFQAYAQDNNIGSDLAVGILRDTRFDPHLYPYLTCETGGGNQVTGHRRPRLTANDIAAIPLVQLGSGVNLPGYYVFHGGSNPVGKLSTFQESRATGYPNDVPVLSYDFQAPIREFGQLNQSYRPLKTLHLFLADFGDILAPMVPVFPANLPHSAADADTLRYTIRVNQERGFLFVNNYQRHVAMQPHAGVQIRVKLADEDIVYPAFPVAAGAYFIWPFNLDLGGIQLRFAQAQLVCRLSVDDTTTYVFAATPGISPKYCFTAATVQNWTVTQGEAVESGDELIISNIQPGAAAAIRLQSNTGQTVQIITLTPEQALNLWKGELAGHTRLVLTDADVMFNQNTLILSSTKAEIRLAVYPAPDNGFIYQDAPLPAGNDGILAAYSLHQAARPVDVRVEPNPAREYSWFIHLPADTLAGVNDVFLRLTLACDKAYLYAAGTLLADHFYNGEVWEIGLKRFAEQITRGPLQLVLDPLSEDADIYLEVKPNFVGGLAAALNKVEAVVQHQFETIVPAPAERQRE